MSNIKEINFMNELTKSLTQENVRLLQEKLRIPPAIVERTRNNPTAFLYALKYEMHQFNPTEFFDALNRIGRSDLIQVANKLEWLNPCNIQRFPIEIGPPSVETFVRLLKTEITSNQWQMIIGSGLSMEVTQELNFENSLKLSIEGGIISPDLELLCDTMIAVERYDVVEQVQTHAHVFHGMNKGEFQTLLMDELESSDREQENWVVKLREYTKQQNENVYLRFDDDEAISLDSVYTPLTVVKEIVMQSSDDTSLNEIDFLRRMSENEKSLKIVDFISIVSTLDPKEPTVLCLIGNPGSGKTFLCKYLALQYAKREHNNFLYQISAQCRSEDWHKMEKKREENEEKINTRFVRDFLAKTLPSNEKWSRSLPKYLVETEGEGLLLILDGVDEFSKNVPFKSTLLYSLLNRQVLTRSTVLLTSRPGAWSNIREEHGQELKVASNYQVLGFSPADRDTYFKKRICTADKLRETKQLFFRHDEINQLSLVPVNACLFSSLFNETTNILSQTLTNLYTELILYIVRRQLSRMGLKRLTRVHRMSKFHPSVWKCIRDIGYEAYEGIFHRELSSREEDMRIRIDESEYTTERLGIMQVHVSISKLGQRINVWTFAHLTIQEHMAAVYLSDMNWLKECVIVRFLVSSDEVFAMYKMVLRFLCGLLEDRAACLIPIICHNLTTDTMPLIELPMIHQLFYLVNLVRVSDWLEFIKSYLLISTVIIETNSLLIPKYFRCLRNLLPENVYFHFNDSVSPNEWHCFLLSLNYIRKLQIVFINTFVINPTQFSLFLKQLSSCSLSYLALAFFRQDYRTIQSYTTLLLAGTSVHYKVSIELNQCELTEMYPSTPLFSTHNQFMGSIKLYQSKVSDEILTQLMNQFSRIENMYYAPRSDYFELLITYPLLTKNIHIKGLRIEELNTSVPTISPGILFGLSSLQELYWAMNDPYTVLPYLLNNSKLTCLNLYSPRMPHNREYYRHNLTEIIRNNSNSLREICLVNVNTVGIHSWTSILSPLQSCHKLVRLVLLNCPFPPNDISYWYTAIRYLQSLVALGLIAIPMGDTGFMILCKSLNLHPAIRDLSISKCKLTSNSCEPISMLIHTLPYMRRLMIHKPELSHPYPVPLQLIVQTAEMFSVKIAYRN